MIKENTPFVMIELNRVFTFFIYQKGLAFVFAFFALTLLLFNQSREQRIEAQIITIDHLEKRGSDLKEALESSLETEPHLNVKTGYKMKPIPLSEIIWIQADDYCVKIHTEEKTFTLRQSLKELEKKLSYHRFLRIHRGILLNMQYLNQVNYEASLITLTNEAKLPISKTGMRALKESLLKSSV